MPAQLKLFGPEFRHNKHWPEVPICSCVETHPNRPFISDGPGHEGIGWHGDFHCPNITPYIYEPYIHEEDDESEIEES